MNCDFSQKYRINVTGSSDELKLLLKELFDVLGYSNSYSQIKENVDNLENIVQEENYTFGIHHRIYFNKNHILYVPNVSGNVARKFHYETFKSFFDIARENIEK
ncbi:MAG: hypothetical protein WC758_02455 [Candidatus Woesearchaeota archaeon]